MTVFELFSTKVDDGMYPKYNWQTLDRIPNCQCFKFDKDQPLNFIKQSGCQRYDVITLPISDVLDLMGDDLKYDLHPVKWYRMKKKISEGAQIEYPWISANRVNVKLMDGLNQLVIMQKFLNMTLAQFVVAPEEREQVDAYFSSLHK